MKKLPLTIVIAILNEEVNLPGLLDHLRGFADEIVIVVDFRNVDHGPAIARKYGCKIILDTGESQGVVFNNKNTGIDQAKNDWVLILDADERMTKLLQKEIRQVVIGKSTSASIYQTSFINYEFGKLFSKCDQPQKPFVRLFRKGSFRYQTTQTTEGFDIQTAFLSQSGNWGKIFLKIPLVRSWYLHQSKNLATFHGHLIHLSHPSILEFVRKVDHYSSREARLLFEANPSVTYFHLVLRILFSPPKEFVYKYFIWKFYKEGIHGYIVSVIYAFYYFLINAKYFRSVYEKNNATTIKAFKKKYHFDV